MRIMVATPITRTPLTPLLTVSVNKVSSTALMDIKGRSSALI